MPTTAEPLTLPHVALAFGVGLDVLRSFLRKHPSLTALGVVYGRVRVYSPDAVSQIRAAFFASRKPATAPGSA